MPALSGLSGMGEDYKQRVLATRSAALLRYWMLDEASGTSMVDSSANADHGVYTGVDLAQPGIGDGRTCPNWDGVNDKGNAYTAALAAAFPTAEGSLGGFCKVSGAGVYADGTTRQVAGFRVDANNRVFFGRSTGAGSMTLQYSAGGTAKLVTATLATLGWFHMCLTWSKAADEVRAYINGIQIGATQTGLGTWVGAVASSAANIGATLTTPSGVWSGSIAHVGLWNAPLTPAEVALLGVR